MVLEGSSLEDSSEETSLELSASELETDTVFPLGLLLELLVWLPVLAGGAVEPWPWPIPPDGFSSGAEDELDGSLAWELLEDDPGSWEELPGISGVDGVEEVSVGGVEGLETEDPCPSSLGVTLAWDAWGPCCVGFAGAAKATEVPHIIIRAAHAIHAVHF